MKIAKIQQAKNAIDAFIFGRWFNGSTNPKEQSVSDKIGFIRNAQQTGDYSRTNDESHRQTSKNDLLRIKDKKNFDFFQLVAQTCNYLTNFVVTKYYNKKAEGVGFEPTERSSLKKVTALLIRS